jgi:hypothetical protein
MDKKTKAMNGKKAGKGELRPNNNDSGTNKRSREEGESEDPIHRDDTVFDTTFGSAEEAIADLPEALKALEKPSTVPFEDVVPILKSLQSFQAIVKFLADQVQQMQQTMPHVVAPLEAMVPSIRGAVDEGKGGSAAAKDQVHLWWKGSDLSVEDIGKTFDKVLKEIPDERVIDVEMIRTVKEALKDVPKHVADSVVAGLKKRSTVKKKRRRASKATVDKDRVCSHCGTSETPFWRRNPVTEKYMCNACGLYLSKHGEQRPLDTTNT